MKLSITYIKLRSVFHLFTLISNSGKMIAELPDYNCLGHKISNSFLEHYTMTLWENESDLYNFVKSDLHLKMMKRSGQLASQVRTITIDENQLIDWKEAKKIILKGKVINY